MLVSNLYNYSQTLNPQKALIWRVVHRNNIPWILDNGLFCGNSQVQSPNWEAIGSSELIQKRATHPVPISPFGSLNDYVPFYFTPFSPMLLNIKSGRGVIQRANEDIVILVSSLHKVEQLNLDFVYTDMHAYYQWANFYSDLNHLGKIDWPILQTRNFARDLNDPAKFERYQAEALIKQHCPINALVGIACYNTQVEQQLKQHIQQRNINLDVIVRPGWYF